MTQAIGRSLAQVWILAFVGLFGTFLAELVPGLRVPIVLAYLVPLLGFTALRFRGPRDELDVAVIAVIGALALTSIVGVDMLGSLESVGLAIAYGAVFWLMRPIGADTGRLSMIAVPVATALVGWVAIAAVVWLMEKVTWVAAGGGVPPLPSTQGLLWATTNVYPVLVLLAVPFVAAVEDRRIRTLLAWALGISAVVVVPLSDGRAGWLGLAIGALAFALLAGWHRPAWMAVRLRATIAGIVALAGVAIVVLVGGRAMAIIASGLDARLRLWQQALAVFGDDPISGSGTGTFGWVRLAHVPDYTDPIGVTSAHNAWLQVLADGGLVLGAACAVVVALWVVAVWRRRESMSVVQRLAAAAVVGLGGASLLDDFSYLPAAMAAAAVLAGWAAPPSDAGIGRSRWVARGSLAVLGVISVAALLSSLAVESARVAATEGRSAAADGRWQDAAGAFQDAVHRHTTNPHLHLALGLAYAELGRLESAWLSYERARDLSPGDPRTSGAIAAFDGLLGGPEAQVDHLREAARHSTDAQYALRLGNALVQLGREADAADAYALAVLLRTDLYPALSPARRPPVLDLIADRVIVFDSEARNEQALLDAGLVDGSLPDSAPPAWTVVTAAVAGDAGEAAVLLAEARNVAGHDQRTHLAAAAVARLECDEAAYRRAMRLAGRIRDTPVARLAIGRDPIYRDQGLGDYQPSWVERPPAPEPWPFGLVDAPACEWAR